MPLHQPLEIKLKLPKACAVTLKTSKILLRNRLTDRLRILRLLQLSHDEVFIILKSLFRRRNRILTTQFNLTSINQFTVMPLHQPLEIKLKFIEFRDFNLRLDFTGYNLRNFLWRLAVFQQALDSFFFTVKYLLHRRS